MPEIDPGHLLGDLRELATFGAYKTGVHRPTFSPQDATMRQALLNGRTLTVLGESRKLRSVHDAFGDSFSPLGVHIYYAGPAE